MMIESTKLLVLKGSDAARSTKVGQNEVGPPQVLEFKPGVDPGRED